MKFAFRDSVVLSRLFSFLGCGEASGCGFVGAHCAVSSTLVALLRGALCVLQHSGCFVCASGHFWQNGKLIKTKSVETVGAVTLH